MNLTDFSNLPSISLFRFSENRSSYKNLDLISRSFDENILHRLKTLIPVTNPLSITLSWLSLAVDFLSSTHTDAKTLISDLRLSSFDNSLSSYLDDSAKILDLCNSISYEIERLRQRRVLINFALSLVHVSGETRQIPAPEKLRCAKKTLSELKNCSSMFTNRRLQNPAVLIRDLAVGLGNPPRGKISTIDMLVHRTIYAVGALTVFFAGVIVTVLAGSPETIPVRVPTEFLWADAFNGLESMISSDIKKRYNGEQKRFSDDVEAIEKRARRICEVIDDDLLVLVGEGNEERLHNAVKEMKTEMEVFSNGLDCLWNGVNGFFNTVSCARNGLLENLRGCIEKKTKTKRK